MGSSCSKRLSLAVTVGVSELVLPETSIANGISIKANNTLLWPPVHLVAVLPCALSCLWYYVVSPSGTGENPPVSPSGVIEVGPCCAVRVTRRNIRLRRQITPE